jgi:hypothetical protein
MRLRLESSIIVQRVFYKHAKPLVSQKIKKMTFKLKIQHSLKAMKVFLAVALIALLSGCPFFNGDYDFEYHTIVGTTPVNLEELNTEYDDFNSDLPYPAIFRTTHLFFSSNRNSSGNNFDIVYKDLRCFVPRKR